MGLTAGPVVDEYFLSLISGSFNFGFSKLSRSVYLVLLGFADLNFSGEVSNGFIVLPVLFLVVNG